MAVLLMCGARKIFFKKYIEVNMIETVANLVDYLSLKLNITNEKFEIYDANGKLARLGKLRRPLCL